MLNSTGLINMPTAKPRLNLTMPTHLNHTIERLAKLQGVSRGAVVIDLLEGVHPALMKTVVMMEAALNASTHIKQGLSESISKATDEVMFHQKAATAQADLLIDELVGLQAQTDREPHQPNPHIVTRGSGLDAEPDTKGLETNDDGGFSGFVDRNRDGGLDG